MTTPRLVMVTGATGDAGTACCAALAAAGHRVVAVGRDAGRLASLRDRVPGVTTMSADVTDRTAVRALVRHVHDELGRVDGLIHLVGGWRGGGGFAGNSDADWQFLSDNLIQALRHVTQELHDDLAASESGRAAIVSARAAQAPTAGNANYATAKAAAEAWQLALADSLRRNGSGTSAAVIGVITAVGDKPGFTTADDIGTWAAGLFDTGADELNGRRVELPRQAAADADA